MQRDVPTTFDNKGGYTYEKPDTSSWRLSDL